MAKFTLEVFDVEDIEGAVDIQMDWNPMPSTVATSKQHFTPAQEYALRVLELIRNDPELSKVEIFEIDQDAQREEAEANPKVVI